jgi:ABC-type multidrug transport system permease subunit
MAGNLWSWWKRQVAPVAGKEFIHLINDSATLRMAVLLPIMQLLIFGFAINMDVSHIPTAVLNEDLRPASYELIDSFKNTTYFEIKRLVFSKDDLLKAIRKGDVKVGLDIPPNYSDNVLNGRKADFQVLIDGSDSNTANQSMGSAAQIGTVLSQKVQAHKSGDITTADLNQIEAVPHLLYNPDLKTTFLIIPALLAIVLMMVTLMLTTFSIVKEKEQGTMDQLLVTPLRPAGLMVGKILPYVLLGFVDFNFVLLVMVFVFGVPIRGSLPMLELSGLSFLMSVLGLGLIISSFATNQAQAGQIAQMTAMPSILLSGFMFQIQSEPAPIQVLSYMLPTTYFIEILRGLIVRGATIQDLMQPLLIMTAIGVLILGISIFTFRKRSA